MQYALLFTKTFTYSFDYYESNPHRTLKLILTFTHLLKFFSPILSVLKPGGVLYSVAFGNCHLLGMNVTRCHSNLVPSSLCCHFK